MKTSSTINRVLIVAGDSAGNLGDQAILQATCTDLLLINPNLHISVVTNKLSDELINRNICQIKPGIGGLFQLYRAASKADIVLCGGGGLFQDDDSLIKMPYWAIRIFSLRLFCDNIVGYSLGVGPLSAKTSRLSARLAFYCMKQISTRDPIAQKTAQALTRKSVLLVPDPALLLSADTEKKAIQYLESHNIQKTDKIIIGVAVRRWFPAKARIIPNKLAAKFWNNNNNAVMQSDQLCRYIAEVLDQLIDRHNALVVFMPSYNVQHESDDRISQTILDLMKSESGRLLKVSSPALYKAISSKLDIFLCGRMHPSIFSAASATPVVGLAYNPKFHGFFRLLGLEHNVMDVSKFVSQHLVDELSELVSTTITDGHDIETTVENLQDTIRSFNRQLLNADYQQQPEPVII